MAGLDAKVSAFIQRKLYSTYPFLILNAMFIKVWERDRVVSRAAMIVIGVKKKELQGGPGSLAWRFRELSFLG